MTALAEETTVADALEKAAEGWEPGQPVPFIVRRRAAPGAQDALPVLWEVFCEAARARDQALMALNEDERAFHIAAQAADEARALIQHGPQGEAS